MRIAAGLVIVVLASLAWLGQTISWLAPTVAVRLGLMEAEDSVETVFWADIRGEARWDALSLWPLVVGGVMLLADDDDWAIPGLAGGAVYAYFGGRGLLTRFEMIRRGHRIGTDVRTALAFLSIWLVLGTATAFAAALELR